MMNNQTITIGPGTEIDLQSFIDNRALIQGNSGAGKSGLARVIIEETFGKIPSVVTDTDGEYSSLKQLHPDILVIGGTEGDVSLTMSMAESLPAFIIENRLTVITDISEFKPGERIQFVKVFYETLMDLTKEYWVPYIFWLEECHKYAGQQEKYPSGPAIKDLLSRGRKRGFCGVPITQRIAKLHKDVAAECNNKFIGRTNLDVDMDRVAEELGFSAKSKDRLKLRDLKPGEFFAYGRSLNPNYVHEIKIRKPTTTMPKAGTIESGATRAKPTRKILAALEKLAALEITDKKPAKKTSISVSNVDDNAIASLRIELSQEKEKNRTLSAQLQHAEVVISKYKQAGSACVALLKDLDNASSYYSETSIEPSPQSKAPVLSKMQVPKHQSFNKPVKQIDPSAGKAPGEVKILIAIGQHKQGLSKDQIQVFTGYRSTSVNDYTSRLTVKGLIQKNDGSFIITNAGVKALGNNYKPLPTGKALRDHYINTLPGSESRIFSAICQSYPNAVTKETMMEVTGLKQTSVNDYCSRLKRRGIIQPFGKGKFKAVQTLF